MSASKLLSDLPDDLISKILLPLPFNDLLRCKSVCKSWLSIISDPRFAKSQLAFSNAASLDRICIVRSYDGWDDSDTLILLVDLDSGQVVADLDFPFPQDEFPYMPPSLVSLVGSACGIVCVRCSFEHVFDIYLWNPAIKMSKLIPESNVHICDEGDKQRVVLGFGFDVIGDDFKVVRVVSADDVFSAEVYSARRNVWRNVEPSPNDFPTCEIYDVEWDNAIVYCKKNVFQGENFDVCVNGFLCTTGKYGMIAFDLNAEVFNCGIKLPVTVFDSVYNSYRITEYNDSIAAILWMSSAGNDNNIHLWALDDEACLSCGGIQASWTLMQNIVINWPIGFVQGYFNNGDFLLKDFETSWYLYNPDNGEADFCTPGNKQTRDFMNAFFGGQIFRYTKSLYKIAGFTQVAWIWNTEEDDSEDDRGDDN